MSDLRYDSIFDQWVCIAENRERRPVEYAESIDRPADIVCPFCRGNETATPSALATYSHPDTNEETGTDWLVRVVPNRYPAFHSNGSLPRHASSATSVTKSTPPWMPEIPRSGHQEVIIVSPRHIDRFTQLDSHELTTAFQAFRDRVRHAQNQSSIQHTCLFMNCRAQAGASIEHLHFQLVASPVVSRFTRELFDRMAHASDSAPPATSTNGHLADFKSPTVPINRWQEQLLWERQQGERVVEETPHFIAYAPYASRYAFQVRLAPRVPLPGFTELSGDHCRELASLCYRVSGRLNHCLPQLAYNIVFHLPPANWKHSDWFLEFIPRTTQFGGFEIGTDCWINSVSPESASRLLRESDQLSPRANEQRVQ